MRITLWETRWYQDGRAVLDRWARANREMLRRMDADLAALRAASQPTPPQGVNPFIPEVRR